MLVLVAGSGALFATGAMPLVGGGDKVVKVWLMRSSVTNSFVSKFRESYETEHPGVKLSVTIQDWDGITERVGQALGGTSADQPDLIEVGNTQVAKYAASGKVKDLSDKVDELGGRNWLPGLADPGKIDDKQYGVPFYAASRVVIYRKDLFEKAGVEPPRDREEWLEITAKLNKGGTQGIYLPGQNWYVLSGFVWDEGGELAVENKNGVWEGALDTPEAMKGMEFYKRLQALGKGPKDRDESDPLQTGVLAHQKVAQMIGVPGQAAETIAENPRLEDKLAFFPVPGKKEDKPGTVFTGGSDLIIPSSSDQEDAAYDVLAALAGEKWQMELARAMSCAPNKTTLAGEVEDEGTRTMAESAANGRATPNSPDWASVEELQPNPIKAYQTQVLQGTKPLKQAAKEAADGISDALAGG
ncbi:extracellular solute-binding protein [Streptomyces sp. NPDC051940]|uniref:extracellular solute-binding protein n=1 Tax=Streptomyces sp. NPDC051940 TaxID=3155675 RepID=UPI003442E6FD